MTAPDVLAMMGESAEELSKHSNACGVDDGAELREASAAVAELYRERDELIARRQEDMAILDAIRNVAGGPYDTIAKRVAELAEAAKALNDAIAFRIDDPRCALHCRCVDALRRVQGEGA